jgi:hypothetical protein
VLPSRLQAACGSAGQHIDDEATCLDEFATLSLRPYVMWHKHSKRALCCCQPLALSPPGKRGRGAGFPSLSILLLAELAARDQAWFESKQTSHCSCANQLAQYLQQKGKACGQERSCAATLNFEQAAGEARAAIQTRLQRLCTSQALLVAKLPRNAAGCFTLGLGAAAHTFIVVVATCNVLNASVSDC